jgi:hypothetical protein
LEDKQNLLLILKVSFKIGNTIDELLAQNKNINQNEFNKCGVYQLTCHDCNRKYTGQTGRPLYVRFQEHFGDFKHGNGKSKFAQHLTDKHSIAPMEDIMEILHINKKGSIKDTLERLHMYNVTRLDNQITHKCTPKYNAIFDTNSQKLIQRAFTAVSSCIRLDLAQSQTATLAACT